MTMNDDSDSPFPGLRDLRETTPPPSLVPSVMRRIAEPAPVTFWSWLRRPRRLELRLSPLGAAGIAAVAVGALVLVVGSASVRPRAIAVQVPSAPAAQPGTPAVVVRFALMAQGAHKVAVAGDFNGWDPDRTPLLDQDGRGVFAGNVQLPPGAHEYMFVVDGQWVTDPAAAERRPDGFGRDNAILRL